MELTVLALSFTLLLVLGVPVGFSIGLASIATILAAGMPVAVVFQKMIGGMQVFSFLAIPFFVFAGELMLYGGIAERIVRFANSLVGHVRGGVRHGSTFSRGSCWRHFSTRLQQSGPGTSQPSARRLGQVHAGC
jgi:TRAP-type mannitol/chloroaromatic compound transport system permease large subunit